MSVVMLFGLSIGGALVALGMVTVVFAPKVGPNAIFGVRTSASRSSREAWDKSNRLGGWLMALVGLSTAVLSIPVSMLDLEPSTGLLIVTAIMLGDLAVAVVVTVVAARRYANEIGRR